MSQFASIDIVAMTKLVSAISGASTPLLFGPASYQQVMDPVAVDASPASKLSSVAFWISDVEPDLRRRLALAQRNEAQGKSFQGVVKIDENQLSKVDPTIAQSNGAAAAKQLVDANGKVDPKLVAEIKANQDDPYFAAGLAQNLTPAQLASIAQGASNNYRYSEAGPKSTEFTNYHDLMSALGTTVATATRNTGSLALPPGTAKQWSDLITAEPSGDDNYKPNQAAALSTLLRYGDYDTKFLNTVSSNVYNYERSKGGKPVWRPRSGGEDDILDPDKGIDTTTDALANVLQALGHNPDAAQAFFDVGNPNASTTTVKINGHDIAFNSRLEYLTTERTWSVNDMSDGGTGLGNAIDAATTFYRNNGATGQISATLASQTMALVGNKVGSDRSSGLPLIHLGADDGWKVPNGMRTSLADMVSSYAPDLLRVGPNAATSDDLTKGWTQPSGQFFPPNGPTGASMDKGLLTKLLGNLGEDPKNIDIITTGVGVAGSLRMQYAMQTELGKDKNAPVEMLQGQTLPDLVGASNEIAGTMGYVINSAYKGDASNQDFQKKQAEALSKAMGIVLAAPTFAVPEGAAWTGYLLDQVKDAALDKIGEGPNQNAQGTYNDQASTSSANLQRVTLNNLLAGGYLDKKYFDQAGPKFTPPPQAALMVGADGMPVKPPQFNFASQAYQDWRRGGQNMQTYLDSNVLVPFHDEFPALGTAGGG